MKKGGHAFNDIIERLVGNEQKLVFTVQKFPQTVVYEQKKGREYRKKESYTFRHALLKCLLTFS